MSKCRRFYKIISTFQLFAMLFIIFVTANPASATTVTDIYDQVRVVYFNNNYSGKYIQNSNGSSSVTSGLLSSLGTTIRWQVTPIGDGTYTIRSASNMSLYLTGSITTTDKTICLSTLDDSSIPNQYRWYMTYAESGGYLIQNVNTNMYLYALGTNLSSTSTLGSVGTITYKQRVWRVAEATSFYGDDSSYDKIELPAGYKFKTCHLFAGESIKPELQEAYANVLWDTADNFTFTGFNTNYVTLDSVTGTFTSATFTSIYSTTITATHKVTGRATSFSLVVNPRTASVGVTNVGHDHSTALSDITPFLTNCGYSSANVYTGAFSTLDIDSYLDNDMNAVFVSRSHGGTVISSTGSQVGTAILLNDDSTNKVFYYSTQSIMSLDLTNMDLIMFVACYTGVGGEGGLNLPTVAVNQGAKTAVGFSETIGCNTANSWIKDFFDLLESGMSVNAACGQLAIDTRYSATGMTSYEVCGYKFTRFN